VDSASWSKKKMTKQLTKPVAMLTSVLIVVDAGIDPQVPEMSMTHSMCFALVPSERGIFPSHGWVRTALNDYSVRGHITSSFVIRLLLTSKRGRPNSSAIVRGVSEVMEEDDRIPFDLARRTTIRRDKSGTN
jgi:hypothetical protein